MPRALLLALLLAGTACGSQPGGESAPVARREALAAPAAGRPIPRLAGRVVDEAEVLDAGEERSLTGRLAALERDTGDQLVVLTVDTLGGEAIEAFGLRVGHGWGIGREDLDNGVLLILAAGDRRARIEVGTGLEGLLTDQRAAAIMREKIIPPCAQGRCDKGIEDGAAAIAALLRSDRRRPQPPAGKRTA